MPVCIFDGVGGLSCGEAGYQIYDRGEGHSIVCLVQLAQISKTIHHSYRIVYHLGLWYAFKALIYPSIQNLIILRTHHYWIILEIFLYLSPRVLLVALVNDRLAHRLDIRPVLVALALPTPRFGVVEGPVHERVGERVIAGGPGDHGLLRDEAKLILLLAVAPAIGTNRLAGGAMPAVQLLDDLILLLLVLHQGRQVRVLQVLLEGVVGERFDVRFLAVLLLLRLEGP